MKSQYRDLNPGYYYEKDVCVIEALESIDGGGRKVSKTRYRLQKSTRTTKILLLRF